MLSLSLSPDSGLPTRTRSLRTYIQGYSLLCAHARAGARSRGNTRPLDVSSILSRRRPVKFNHRPVNALLAGYESQFAVARIPREEHRGETSRARNLGSPFNFGRRGRVKLKLAFLPSSKIALHPLFSLLRNSHFRFFNADNVCGHSDRSLTVR